MCVDVLPPGVRKQIRILLGRPFTAGGGHQHVDVEQFREVRSFRDWNNTIDGEQDQQSQTFLSYKNIRVLQQPVVPRSTENSCLPLADSQTAPRRAND